MSDMDKIIREEAHLIMLRTLAGEPDGRLNSETLRSNVETFGITRTREWVQAEMRALEQLGAVTITAAGSVLVAQLTTRGLDHVERRAFLDGVKRPSLPRV
jgi:hypothetical protein